MTTLDLYRSLYAHMAWADAAVWTAVLANEAARADAAMRQRLHHIHLVQRAFLAMWQSVPLSHGTVNPENLDDLLRWAAANHHEASHYLETLDDAQLDRAVVIPWSQKVAERFGREPKTPSLAETLMQVVSHSTHHRAQVSLKLRELGGEPPLTDYIAWTWLGKPAPEWPPAAASRTASE